MKRVSRKVLPVPKVAPRSRGADTRGGMPIGMTLHAVLLIRDPNAYTWKVIEGDPRDTTDFQPFSALSSV